MRLRQLEAFRAVMLCQTVTRAADMLCVSQPAVTRLIADLEKSAGFPLFVRSRGRLHPTNEAHLLYEEVTRSFIGVERIQHAANAIRGLQRGTLHVAAAPSIANSLLPRAIGRFLKDASEIKVTLSSYDSRSIVDMVLGHRCDLGIVSLPIRSSATAQGNSLLSVAHVCAVPAGHRLSKRRKVVPADFVGERLVTYPTLLDSRLLIDAMFASHGVSYEQAPIETLTSAALCSFVSDQQGVALVDAITASEYKGKDVAFISFEPFVPLEYFTLTPLQISPSQLVDRFVSHLRDFASKEIDARWLR